ncbi:4'-demethylrebeccamycin synthase-like protein [Hapsidospora chrysogenum ATCC 11550]|uniref:4'-demethylrebeccamycin synthase-like protein n=1 Tax=Hapsidospora chrysogenum (strain ATCC 11550 / CBS 779.69 / DSM 880 / IAM 14645 / JCM 23072 / IMI 49137) TaxID=857340 RepID=A0A086TG83_HAPC1|nr:4'-demethylrebeccamycin synthase-like protein [Hapsidospora chrysogenum ATCC 11550]
MKVLLHSHFPAGHTYPMQAAAQALVSRGHDVVWLTSADNEARVRVTGAAFAPTSALADLDAPLARRGATGLLETDRPAAVLEDRVLAQVADYRSVIRGGGFAPDVLLVDVLPHGARALWELGEVPAYATLGVIPMYTSTSRAPLPVSGKCPPTSWLDTLVNGLRHLYRQWVVFPWVIRPVINRQRSALGLPGLRYGDAAESFTYSPLLHIQASSPTLEFRQRPKPQQQRTSFVGPLVTRRPTSLAVLPAWWDRVAAHPLVVGITQGTLAMNPTSLIVPSIRALQSDPRNLLVVISPHRREIESQIGLSLNSNNNVLFAEFLPYHVLLPQLRLLITNGGYGSITQALSHGVPLLCAGQTEDKKDTAARVSWAGAGIDLATDNPSVDEVWDAARRILKSDEFHENAARLGDELNELGGADRAVDLLEELARGHTSSAG